VGSVNFKFKLGAQPSTERLVNDKLQWRLNPAKQAPSKPTDLRGGSRHGHEVGDEEDDEAEASIKDTIEDIDHEDEPQRGTYNVEHHILPLSLQVYTDRCPLFLLASSAGRGDTVDESPARRFFSIFNRGSKDKLPSNTVDLDGDEGEPLTLSEPGDAVLVQVLCAAAATQSTLETDLHECLLTI
jgi:hypothetical protein